MAGLQYKFFPTDFFFPIQKTVSGDNISKQNLLIKIRNNDESLIEDSQGKIVINNNKKNLKAISSSSLALVPVPKQKKDQD
ncbi:hypothetical protein KY290_006202 [Solanum tuberosum]|uniref:Uncharacterized protein n=1 Tax=Solanum tuberosum TaxID=4113 RepID=A0ABQ7WID3_SOLTU|nr:hypothetical protein KY284_006309 [Solanum tuberosum]KAH0779775.1 hypothetical protein KY290_006202 [Solanum tuberosum]